MRKTMTGKTADSKATIRCAIYTRKSSEEGLEQDFNSLDAQREACEAFIKSQRHEGWVCLPEMYDDGGISGATLERPALKRLLGDIETRKVDTVVVYKVDRLTRSLGDFAVPPLRRRGQRTANGLFYSVARNALRPIGLGENTADEIKIEPHRQGPKTG